MVYSLFDVICAKRWIKATEAKRWINKKSDQIIHTKPNYVIRYVASISSILTVNNNFKRFNARHFFLIQIFAPFFPFTWHVFSMLLQKFIYLLFYSILFARVTAYILCWGRGNGNAHACLFERKNNNKQLNYNETKMLFLRKSFLPECLTGRMNFPVFRFHFALIIIQWRIAWRLTEYR